MIDTLSESGPFPTDRDFQCKGATIQASPHMVCQPF